MTKDLVKVSKFLSLILRHEPGHIGLTLQKDGWVSVDALMKAAKEHDFPISTSLLNKVVINSDKQRFAFNANKTKIRANQGHSINVEMVFSEATPIAKLYHGTVSDALESISNIGISKMTRQYVHLADNIKAAERVGARRGKPIVLAIDAKKMADDGYSFYLSENGVWLIDIVPTKYIVMGKLQFLLNQATGGDMDKAIYGRFPVQIHKDCGANEVKEILHKLDQLSDYLKYLDDADGESREEVRSFMGGFSNLLEKLVGQHALIITEGLDSVYSETKFFISCAFYNSPNLIAVNALAKYVRTDLSEYNLEMGQKALKACENKQRDSNEKQGIPDDNSNTDCKDLGLIQIFQFMSFYLPLREKPSLYLCRDGGSIHASVKNFWGVEYLIELPVEYGDKKSRVLNVVGYKAASISKIINIEKNSKVTGRSYFESSK